MAVELQSLPLYVVAAMRQTRFAPQKLASNISCLGRCLQAYCYMGRHWFMDLLALTSFTDIAAAVSEADLPAGLSLAWCL